MADLNILDLLAALGPIAGGAAKSNQTQNNFEDVTKSANWNNLETQRLARDKFAAAAPGQRLQTSNLANMTKNFTPTSIQWGGKGSGLRGELPVYSGGASHVGKDPRVQATADSVLGQELESQLAGAQGADSKMSAQPLVGQTSALDKILGGLGLGGSALDALKKAAGNGGGSSLDLGKLIDSFKHHGLDDGSRPSNDSNPDGFEWDPESQGYGMDPNQRDGGPDGDVNTDQFVGQWPETGDPFAAFDPNLLRGGGGEGNTEGEWGF